MLGTTDALKQIQGARSLLKPDDPTAKAFDAQMRMMQQMFSNNEQSMTGASTGADDNFMGDALMYDALSTISRLFSKTAGQGLAAAKYQATAATSETTPAKAKPIHDTGMVKADNTIYEVVNGELSAVFESGKKGAAAVGYDHVGGTSYGTYQIASRTGSMDRFVHYLRSQAPDLANRLSSAGPFNTGSKYGSMPRAWKQIASEAPERFEKLQREFIKKDHYVPARNKILASTGVDIDQAPSAIREVLWSTAVQHGASGAARIFNRAIAQVTPTGDSPNFVQLVSDVYDSRKHQFHSSSGQVRRSVQSRLAREENVALTMLKRGVNQMV
ncbi:MAG: hypothetical protein KKC99_05220 [Proteobacteria bacterium]|nr:hypothetical protein [Pseudomonadota bacterium]